MPNVFQSVRQVVVVGQLHGVGELLVKKIKERPLTEAGMVASEVFVAKNVPALVQNQLWGRVDKIVVMLERGENDERLAQIAKVLLNWQKKVVIVGGNWNEKWVLTAQNEAARKKMLWQKMSLGMNLAQAAMIWGNDIWGCDEETDREMAKYLTAESKVMDKEEWLGEVVERLWRGVDSIREEIAARRISPSLISARLDLASREGDSLDASPGTAVAAPKSTKGNLLNGSITSSSDSTKHNYFDPQLAAASNERLQPLSAAQRLAQSSSLDPAVSSSADTNNIFADGKITKEELGLVVPKSPKIGTSGPKKSQKVPNLGLNDEEVVIARLAMPRVKTQNMARARAKIDKQKLGETQKRIEDYSQKITELAQTPEKTPLSPPLSGKMKKKERKRRNMLLIGSFLVAGMILVGAGVWWNYAVVREKFLGQLERVYLDCWVGENDCSEGKKMTDLEKKQADFSQQTSLLSVFVDEEDKSRYQNLFEQTKLLTRWQNEETKSKALEWQNYGKLLGMSNSVVGEDKRAILRQQTLILQGIKALVGEANEKGWLSEELGVNVGAEISQKESELQESDKIAALLEMVWTENGNQWWVVLGERAGKLRPGGGTVEEILLVEMNKGKLGTVLFYEPHQIDALVTEAAAIASPLDSLLGQKNMTIGELGLEGDFEKLASGAEGMLGEALGVKIDGLMGIKLAQGESLESWWNQMSVITEAKGWETWLGVQKKLLNEGKIRVWVKAVSAEEAVKELGWAGNLGLPDCKKVFGNEKSCVSDGVQILLTDTSKNEEQNTWRMSSQQEIVVQENRVEHVGEWTLENVSGGGGDVYWQWLVPNGAFNLKVWEGGVQTTLDDNLGKVVRVEAKGKKTLKLSFELAKETVGDFGLSFRQKMPEGIAVTSTKLRVKKTIGKNWTLLSPMPTLDGDELVFTHEGGEDMLVVVQTE